MPALSILPKIHDMTLNLKGYSLNKSHIEALVEACKTGPKILDSILLDSNGLKDKSMAKLLEGLSKLHRLKKFACSNNQMMGGSVHFLTKIINNPKPVHLDELRLNNCKLSRNFTADLLTELNDKHVRKLSLIKCNLDHSNIIGLRTLIENSQVLIDLDISWNEMTVQAVADLTETLNMDRRLQYLNLSFNNLI